MSKYSSISLILIMLLPFVLVGCRNEISDHCEDEIMQWYYTSRCINNTKDLDGEIIERKSISKDFMISAIKIGLGLKEDWIFNDQTIDIHKISLVLR